MAKIPNFDPTRLRFGAHFAVMTSFGEKVAPIAESESMLTAAYGEFTAALDYEDSAIKIARASEYTKAHSGEHLLPLLGQRQRNDLEQPWHERK